jgi:hypothetical protein
MVVKLAVARFARPDLFASLAADISDEVAGHLKALRHLVRSSQTGFQEQALTLEIARRQAEIRWLSSILEDPAAAIAQRPGYGPSRADDLRSERFA